MSGGSSPGGQPLSDAAALISPIVLHAPTEGDRGRLLELAAAGGWEMIPSFLQTVDELRDWRRRAEENLSRPIPALEGFFRVFRAVAPAESGSIQTPSENSGGSLPGLPSPPEPEEIRRALAELPRIKIAVGGGATGHPALERFDPVGLGMEVGGIVDPRGRFEALRPFEEPRERWEDIRRGAGEGSLHRFMAAAPLAPQAIGGTAPPSFDLIEGPGGVNAALAADFTGGNGAEVQVCVVDSGYEESHPYLAKVKPIAPRAGFLGEPEHGTNMLGVLGAETPSGAVGVCPAAELRFASQARGYRPQCVGDALAELTAGDVLVTALAAEVFDSGGSRSYVPVEYDADLHAAFLVAAGLGIVVVQAAGNNNLKLDSVEHAEEGLIWTARHPRGDSLAVIVGAGWPAVSGGTVASLYCRGVWGPRVNCQGWAGGVGTTRVSNGATEPASLWEPSFGRTSAASAVIAGVTACIQGRAKAKLGHPLPPQLVRSLLSCPGNGTPQPLDDAAKYPIGPLPDLEKIFRNAGLD